MIPLRIENLSVTYVSHNREVRAVRDVNLCVAAGEIVGVVGEGGSGRSTVIGAIVDLLPLHAEVAGTITVLGRELRKLSFKEQQLIRGRELGTILPGGRSALNPMAKVGDQIANALRAQGVKRADAMARAVSLIRAVGIPDPELRANAYPHELSGGMAQRVVIGIALANNPNFIVCDEPTSGLDVTIGAGVLDLMMNLIERSEAAALIATRDLGIVAERCSRIVLMSAGQVVEDSPVEVFFEEPRSAYGRDLLAYAQSALSRTESASHQRTSV